MKKMFDKGGPIPYNNERRLDADANGETYQAAHNGANASDPLCADANGAYLVDVRPILYAAGKSLTFRFALDLSGLDFNGRYPVTRPVDVEGVIRNRADALFLDLSASSVIDAVCDRCGKPFPLRQRAEYQCALSETPSENDSDDEIVPLQNGFADVGELARAAFILAMDSKTLCSEDCKGLCPQCGANLNDGPCACVREPDPRWAALSALLNRDSESDSDERS